MFTSLALALLLGAPAYAVDSGDIVIASVKGDVRVTMNGAARAVRAGAVLELPATVQTGSDGAIDLKQGATSISVGPDTQLEFPALEKRGAPVDRIVQPRGNAFYDIGKREGRKLRVETPYLVGVIKGTQFNVAAQEGSTTISLFEGRLEVRATDDGSLVDLHAGEIASRRRGDKSISVIKMDEKTPATAPRSQSQGGPEGSGANAGANPGPLRADAHNDERDETLLRGYAASRPTVSLEDPGSIGAEMSSRDVAPEATANANANVAIFIESGANAGIDVANEVRVDAVVNPAIDAGPVGVDTDVRATVDVGNGAASVDLGVVADVDVTPTVSVDTGVNGAIDVGGNGVGVDVGAATDVAVGAIDTAVDTSVDLGANLGAGAVDVGAAVDVSTSVPGVDAGVSAGVDVGAGAIDVGVSIGDVDLGLGVDLGLDDGNDGHGNDVGGSDPTNPANTGTPTTPPPANIIEDVGGLLDGLLRRPGRR